MHHYILRHSFNSILYIRFINKSTTVLRAHDYSKYYSRCKKMCNQNNLPKTIDQRKNYNELPNISQ